MEEYAYREAVGEEIESPARKVDYCLQFLREEFPTVEDALRGPDEMAVSSPEGRHLVEVAHTYDDPRPGLLEGIAEETGCEVVGHLESYRANVDCVETLVWIVPTDVAAEYDRERMERETTAWQDGAYLKEGKTFEEAKRHVAKRTGYYAVLIGLTYYLQTPAFAGAWAGAFGGAGETFASAFAWVAIGLLVVSGFALLRDWGTFLGAWRERRGE